MIRKVLKEHPYLASVISTIIVAVSSFIITTWYDLERTKDNVASLRSEVNELKAYDSTQDTRMWDLYIRSRNLAEDNIETE